MKLRFTLTMLALACCAGAIAAPRPFAATESFKLALPGHYNGTSVAIEGTWLAATGYDASTSQQALFLYRRASGSGWLLDRTLFQTSFPGDGETPGPHVALENGIIA